MSDDTAAPFLFPAVGRKKVTAGFDGGRLTSDGGVMLLAAAGRRLGIADRLAGLIADPRNPQFVTHGIADILRARVLAIACGYEDADDLDHLRTDPGFKLACGRLPDSGHDLCSQPAVSRWENAPTLHEVVRLSYAMVDTYCTRSASQNGGNRAYGRLCGASQVLNKGTSACATWPESCARSRRPSSPRSACERKELSVGRCSDA